MRKVVVSEFLTLDGVMEEPRWTLEYFGEEEGQFKLHEMMTADDLLLGRVTYEGFAAAWPSRTDEDGYAERINTMPKHLVTTTLTEGPWQNTHIVAADNLAEYVTRLKQQPGQDILVFGSGQLVQTLMQHNLVDEFRLMVFPLVVGKGQRLFQEGSTANLKLVSSKAHPSGVTVLTYAPAPKKEEANQD
ncbi:dihydrofolate reductase [Hymenobacter oligotrophus]|uniref:Dihydrofolate reductase n=1 Tax=Hymenobacter oligotrophus TaxID=2319843 RepID=A0A3B7R183_9BACT|nr:dihydrofolate reductase family protein [Hymenobacter oligotrophus]AYA37532.1 dihydrofolate reductase [Hymenobacter oligotrophus]